MFIKDYIIKQELLNPEKIELFFQKLLDSPILSSEDLQKWKVNRSDFEDTLNELQSVLYIRMTSQTDNEEYLSDYKFFIKNCLPLIKAQMDKLDEYYLLNAKKYEETDNNLYFRKVNNRSEIFKKENVALETEISLLSQEYQSLCAGLSIEYKNKIMTMQMMQPYLQSPDRCVREEVWYLIAEKRMKQKDQVAEIFSKMLTRRNKIAFNSGFDNFRDYQFKKYERFDYSPCDCERFHQDVKKNIIPLLKRIHEYKKESLAIEALYPWDLNAVMPEELPLKPFNTVEELSAKTTNLFNRIDSELELFFKDMCNNGLLDLESRVGKAPGGYQVALSAIKKPFIFMNAVGVDHDLRTLFHESGHAFHTYFTRKISINENRTPPIEFCEVASMSMELFCSYHTDLFYSEDDRKRSFFKQLEDIIKLLPWIAQVDSFQHWLYTRHDLAIDDINNKWLELCNDYGSGLIDWSSNEEYHKISWHSQLHIFEYPFYYIEYGIAQLGALSMWQKFIKDQSSAIELYKKSLSRGGEIGLRELFSEASIPFSLDEGVVLKNSLFLKNKLEENL